MDRHGPLLKGRRLVEAVLAASLLCALSVLVVGRPHAPVAGANAVSHAAFQSAISSPPSPSLASLGIDLPPPIHTTDLVAGQVRIQPGG